MKTPGRKTSLTWANENLNLVPYGKILLFLISLLLIGWYFYLSATHVQANLPSPLTILLNARYNLLLIFISLIFLIFIKKIRNNLQAIIYTTIVFTLTSLFSQFLPLTPYPLIDAQLSQFDQMLGIDSAKIFWYMANHYHELTRFIFYGYNSLFYIGVFSILILALFNPTNLKRLTIAYLITFLITLLFCYFFPSYGPATLPKNAHARLLESIIVGKKLYFLTKYGHFIETSNTIAFPSYHLLLMLFISFFIKDIKWLGIRYIIFAYTIFLIPAVIILAEHFAADLLGSFIFFGLSLGILKLMEKPFQSSRQQVLQKSPSTQLIKT